MRSLLLAAGLALLAPGAAVSAPCSSGSLADYIALGSSGCTIGAASFSDFAALPVPAAATPIAPTAVIVLPFEAGPDEPGLRFLVDVSASASEFLDVAIGYLVSAPSLVRATLALEDTAVTGDGVVTAIEDLCFGGPFAGGPLGCTGASSDTLIAFDVGDDAELAVGLDFGPVAALGVVTDLGVDGGLGGSAALSAATNRFLVPEPTTAVLLAAGALALALARRTALRG
jgi:hypothetical protein